jgi:hypothetical protein
MVESGELNNKSHVSAIPKAFWIKQVLFLFARGGHMANIEQRIIRPILFSESCSKNNRKFA